MTKNKLRLKKAQGTALDPLGKVSSEETMKKNTCDTYSQLLCILSKSALVL